MTLNKEQLQKTKNKKGHQRKKERIYKYTRNEERITVKEKNRVKENRETRRTCSSLSSCILSLFLHVSSCSSFSLTRIFMQIPRDCLPSSSSSSSLLVYPPKANENQRKERTKEDQLESIREATYNVRLAYWNHTTR